MNNKLYITNDVKNIELLARNFAKNNNLEFVDLEYNRDSIETIIWFYKQYNNMVIFLKNINHDNISNGLLKVLEDNNKNIHIFATTMYFDLSTALLARFDVQQQMVYTDTAINKFINNEPLNKDEYSKLDFYISLADFISKNADKYFIHNLLLINNIVENITLCTYNTPYQVYYDTLKENYRRC